MFSYKNRHKKKQDERIETSAKGWTKRKPRINSNKHVAENELQVTRRKTAKSCPINKTI